MVSPCHWALRNGCRLKALLRLCRRSVSRLAFCARGRRCGIHRSAPRERRFLVTRNATHLLQKEHRGKSEPHEIGLWTQRQSF